MPNGLAIYNCSTRDCPKRGLSNAPKVHSGTMRRPKSVKRAILGAL
jgi:hypothetical protein